MRRLLLVILALSQLGATWGARVGHFTDGPRPYTLRDCQASDTISISHDSIRIAGPWRRFCYGGS